LLAAVLGSVCSVFLESMDRGSLASLAVCVWGGLQITVPFNPFNRGGINHLAQCLVICLLALWLVF